MRGGNQFSSKSIEYGKSASYHVLWRQENGEGGEGVPGFLPKQGS